VDVYEYKHLHDKGVSYDGRGGNRPSRAARCIERVIFAPFLCNGILAAVIVTTRSTKNQCMVSAISLESLTTFL